MLIIWGRTNSVNVKKVLWCSDELLLDYERIDAGMQFGRNNEPEYLRKNPNGRIPLLEDGDYVLWESNAIMRYLAMQYGEDGALYPADPRTRAGIDRWLDWTLSTLQPTEVPLFWGMVRTPAAERDMAAMREKALEVGKLWAMVDTHLQGRRYMEGETFSIADIALAALCRRFLGLDGIDKPRLPRLEAWYESLQERPGFQRHVAPPLS